VPYLLLGILAALFTAVPAFATSSDTITAKKAEAQQIYARVQQLDADLAKADEQVNFANYKLASVQHEITVNRHELRVAQLNLKKSQKLIAERLVSLYTTPQSSTLEVILGAKNLDQIITNVDSEHRVSSVDTQVIDQVQTFKSAVKRRGLWLASANMQARQLVAQRRRVLQTVTRDSDESKQLLSQIQGQIATLEAQQAAAELEAARQARANLAEAEGQVLSSTTVIGATGQVPGDEPILPASSYTGVVGVAMQYLGTPYVWAGAAPGGFDCSGLVMYAYAQVGVSLPHSSYAMWDYGVPVSKDQLEPGDIVFFDGLGHVGLYVGGGDFIQAPHTGDVVKISNLDSGSYADSYVGARRIL
jgi:cell wall-associated NlpC family hydrolase